jgi:hypothetical protein
MPKTFEQIPISSAIRKLVDTIEWGVVNDYDLSTIDWRDESVAQPTDNEINAKRQELADEFNRTEYIDIRVNGKYESQETDNGEKVLVKVTDGYPSISEQLDMLWHAIDSDSLDKTSDFYVTLKAVKDAAPKPE